MKFHHRTTHWLLLGAIATLVLAGCGGSTNERTESGAGSASGVPADPNRASDQTAGEATSTPSGAVTVFLDAVRDGDDERTAAMLTDLARRKVAEMDLGVAPPGSDTAEFEIGETELLGDDGARVATRWTDLDGYGARQTHEMVWMLRRQSEGWRVAGVAAVIFPSEPPLLLNFEDPEEMIRRQELLAEEVVRRMREEELEVPPREAPPQSHEFSGARGEDIPATASRSETGATRSGADEAVDSAWR